MIGLENDGEVFRKVDRTELSSKAGFGGPLPWAAVFKTNKRLALNELKRPGLPDRYQLIPRMKTAPRHFDNSISVFSRIKPVIVTVTHIVGLVLRLVLNGMCRDWLLEK